MVIVSPHFDDAALSCVSLVVRHPGAVLLTVFGAGPPRVDPITRWDRASGFAPGDDVIAARAAEDLDACDALGVRQVRLKHWDSQYRTTRYGYDGPPDGASLVDSIVASIDEVVRNWVTRTDGVFHLAAPLGIGHGDHMYATRAVLIGARRLEGADLVLYEELPYAAERPRMRKRALQAVEEAGFSLEPLPLDMPGVVDKHRVIGCYASQVRALGSKRVRTVLDAEERYWRATVE